MQRQQLALLVVSHHTTSQLMCLWLDDGAPKRVLSYESEACNDDADAHPQLQLGCVDGNESDPDNDKLHEMDLPHQCGLGRCYYHAQNTLDSYLFAAVPQPVHQKINGDEGQDAPKKHARDESQHRDWGKVNK